MTPYQKHRVKQIIVEVRDSVVFLALMSWVVWFMLALEMTL